MYLYMIKNFNCQISKNIQLPLWILIFPYLLSQYIMLLWYNCNNYDNFNILWISFLIIDISIIFIFIIKKYFQKKS